MAEEFYMSVTFEMKSAEQMETLETLIEHFDLCETDEARSLLGGHSLTTAQRLISNLTAEHSDYSKDNDLIDMFADTYNDSVEDMELRIDESYLKGEISVDGYDHEADDFCAALVLILVTMDAHHIEAKAGAVMWNARWESMPDGQIQFNFEAEE